MKKFLQQSYHWLVLLVAMIVGAATAWADTTTFNVVGVQPQAITQGPVTLTPNGNGWMAYSTSGWYAVDQTAPFTVSCAAGYKVNSVKVYQSWDSFGAKTFTASVSGNTSNSTAAYYLWEGEGTSITFTSSNSFTVVFDRVEVSYSAAGPIEKPAFPVEGQAYQLKHNASGLYLNVVKDNTKGTVLGDEAQPLTFTWDATKGGFTIQNNVDLYVGSHSNDWNMSCSLAEYWTVEGTEGAYTLKRTGTAKYLNFNSPIAVGSAAFRDKATGAVFSIEPYVAPTVYSYRVQFTGYPDGEAPNLMYDGLYYGQDDVVSKTNVQLTESDIQVTNIAGYDYDVAISHPQGEAYGQVLVTFAQREVNYFTIPAEAFRKDIDVTYDNDWNEVPTSMYFRVLASDVPGLDSFKYTGNGKQITARLTAEGAEPRNAYLTIYGSYDGTQASVKPFDLALADKAFSVTFPKGAFEAANGDLSEEFTYSYDPAANRVTYTFHFFNSDTSATLPADLAVVYANALEGDHYTNGSSYVALYTPSAADFTSLNPYWEIDLQRSNVTGTNINLYFNQQPYKYSVTIEGNDNAVVTVKGQDYSNNATVETYQLLTDADVTYNAYRGYTLGTTELTQPAEGKDGAIYVKYDAKAMTYATLNENRTSPAPGTYSLDDRDYGFQYFNVYFNETMSEDVSIAKADLASAGITLRDADGRDIEFGDNGVNAWADGQYFNFSAKEAITTPGTYTLHIPAGIFYFGEKQEMTNPELNLEWTLTAAQYYTVQSDGVKSLGDRMNPEKEGSSLKNLRGFQIAAPEGVTFESVDNAKLYIAPERGGMMGGETNVEDLTEATGYSITLDATGNVLVSFDPVLAPAGYTYYSYVIPAGSIASTDGRTNKQISLSTSVDPTVYFDLVVTYPTDENAVDPVGHITIQLPESYTVRSVSGEISFNGHSTSDYTYTQKDRELTITFPAEYAAHAGSYAGYSINTGVITGVDGSTPVEIAMANSSVKQYNIPVTAAPVEYFIEFAGLEGVALPAAPAVTYNGQNYNVEQHITAADLTVEQLQASDISGYEYTITIDEPGYVQSHGYGRILVTYSKALDLVAVPLDPHTWGANADGISIVNSNVGDNGTEIWGAAEGADFGWGVLRINSANPIRKVVMTVSSDAASVMEKDAQGAFAVSGNTVTWTGNADALVFSASEDIYVQSLVVYYEKIATVADVELTGEHENHSRVDASSVPSVITLHLATPASSTHSYYAGQTDIPEGVRLFRYMHSTAVTLPNGEEQDITIKAFNYFAGQDYVNIELEESQILPGQYRLVVPDDIIPCGAGHTNSSYTVTWVIGKFPIDEVTVIGNQEEGSNAFTEITGLEVVPAEGLTFDDDYVLHMTADGAYPTMTYVVNDDEVTINVTGVKILDNGHLQVFFDEPIDEDGDYVFTLNAGVLLDADSFANAEVGNIHATIDSNTYFDIVSAFGYDNYLGHNSFDAIVITSNWSDWSGFAADVTKELFIAGEDEDGQLIYKTVTVSYFDADHVRQVQEQEVADVEVHDNNITLIFAEDFTVPFDTEYTVSFPKGFIDFPVAHVMSNGSSFDQMMKRSYDYRIVYDESVPEGAQLYRNEFALENGASFGSIAEMTDADFTATPVEGAKTIITVVQPEADNNWEGSITLSYETIEPVLWDGECTLNGVPSNLGEDFLCSITSFTLPAPEGHTFASAEDCAMLFKGNLDTEYEPYEVTATISEDGSEVTITLNPAYSTPGNNIQFVLQPRSLYLENGAEYVGFNCGTTVYPKYAFVIESTDPTDGEAIYNGELNAIDVYLPAGVYPYTNTECGIEVVGTDYKESFSCTGISNWGDFHRIQLPDGMSLPNGRITVTIPAGMFYYTSNEDGQTYQNAPWPIWLDNHSALQLVAEPAAGTVVGLDAIRVKGERGTLWTADTDAEALAQHITFGTWEGPVAVTTAIENGVLVVTPVETLAEGSYTLTIDGLAGILESADVAASVNAPARFEFNVVGSTFAFRGAQPYNNKIISELTELETINLSFDSWTVGNVRVSEQAGNDPIAVTLTDGDGAEQTIILTNPAVSESERGGSVAQLVGKVQGSTYPSTADGKYNVSLTIPAGIFVSDNGRTNEAMTLHYVYDSNKYFAVSPNFESWGHVTGPVKTFTLTAAEGVTFTGIAPDKVDDPENGVDRPTVFNNSGYVTYAIPTISADGKSVTLALAEPISADNPNEQYYLVVPDGLFTGTLGTAEGVTFPATSTGIGAWQKIFYIDAPAYDHVEISGPVENGESITSYGGYIYVYVNKTIGGEDGIPAGTTFTSADGQSVDINNMWSVWSSDYSYFVVNTASNLQPGTYTLHVPADSRYADGVIDFTFTLVETFDLADGTFAPTGTVVAQTLESFTWTAPEGKTIQSVDVTKIGNWGYDDNSNWTIIPLAGLSYAIAGEKNQVVFTFAEPISPAEGEFNASIDLIFQSDAITCADGSMSRSGNYSVTIDPFPNDINRDGKEDNVDDAIAISDIILRMDRWYENNTSKADLNGDGEVTIGDLVKYIQQLQPSVNVKDEPTEELGD